MAWLSLSLVEEDRELRAVASISFPPPVVVTATLAFPSGIGRLCSGSISGRGGEEEAQHPHEPPFGLLLRLVRALFRPLPRRFSPFFQRPPPSHQVESREEKISPSLSLLRLFPPPFLSLSLSETPLSNPRFSARVFPSLRERTRVWLITWSSDICADRKLRTSPFVYMREREEVLSSFRPVPPFSFNPWRYDADVLFQSRVLSG